MSCSAAQKIGDRFNGSIESEVVSDRMRLWQLQLRRATNIFECNDPWACSAMSCGTDSRRLHLQFKFPVSVFPFYMDTMAIATHYELSTCTAAALGIERGGAFADMEGRQSKRVLYSVL